MPTTTSTTSTEAPAMSTTRAAAARDVDSGCFHALERIDEPPFRYRCTKCKKKLKILSGVLVPGPAPEPAMSTTKKPGTHVIRLDAQARAILVAAGAGPCNWRNHPNSGGLTCKSASGFASS